MTREKWGNKTDTHLNKPVGASKERSPTSVRALSGAALPYFQLLLDIYRRPPPFLFLLLLLLLCTRSRFNMAMICALRESPCGFNMVERARAI